MRTVDKIYDTTSASGGSLDTGPLNTARYNEGLVILAVTVGSNGGSAYTASIYDDSGAPGAAVLAKTLTAPGAATSTLDSWCRGGTINSPCPDWARFQITAGASSTVRLIVHGVASGVSI